MEIEMKNMSLSQIAEACGGVYYGDKALADREAASITTDSRQAAEGCLFVAVKGERADGHDFIPAVFRQGALGCLLYTSRCV